MRFQALRTQNTAYAEPNKTVKIARTTRVRSYNMGAMELVERLLHDEALAGKRLATTQEAARRIVRFLLNESPVAEALVSETSVHRSAGSLVWQAVFTGAEGGQIWKSTGLINKQQAMLVARKWEAEARAQRELMGRTARKPIVRAAGAGQFGLSQKEVALIMKLSERAVRQIEKRAIRKLAQHPVLRRVWKEYLGDLNEDEAVLTPEEIEVLFGLAYTTEERLVIRKLLKLLQP